MTETEMNWLKEILSSTKVWKRIDNELEAYVIEGSQWEVDKQLDLFKLDLTLSRSIEENYVK